MAEQGRGFITVNVRTAGGALPVEGALVTVSASDTGTVIAVTLTDNAGLSEIIELPTPPKENSLVVDGGEVSAFYTVDTDKDGFYHVVNANIPVFDGVTAIQQVLLVPIAVGDNELQPNDLTRFENSELPNL
ncbi:MAG: hypothetical protein E7648_05575 [Ruminococcaceae bacterium]|nr:hypothetical protein [Oscillospiraceae bacterium]